MEQKKETSSVEGEMKDSPSNNTRSKGSKVQDETSNLCSPCLSDSTPKKKHSSKPAHKSTGKPTPSRPDPGGSGRSRLAEVRAAALKKKREEIARGSPSGQQVVYDPDATAHEAKNIIKQETGLFMDELMEHHYSPWDTDHIEKPERLICIRKRLRQLGLIDRCKQVMQR